MTNLLNFKGRNTAFAAIGISVIFLIISLLNVQRPALDETAFHYPNVLNFYQNGLPAIFNPAYSAANTPLPYIIVAAVSKIFGPSVLLARIITCLISLLSFLVMLKIFIKLGVPGWYSLAIFFYPYFFANSFVFYVMNYAIFFLSLALLLIINGFSSYRKDFLTGLLFSLAVLCQQFYIVIPVALVLSYLVELYRNNDISTKSIAKLLLRSVLITGPLILPIFIFIKWGGLTHPNFKVHTLSFYPSTITAILTIAGVYAIPFLVQTFRDFNLKVLVVSFITAIALAVFCRPLFTDKLGAGLFTGLTFHVIYFSEKITRLFPIIVLGLFTWAGILSIYSLAKKTKVLWDFLLLLSWFFLAFVFCTNTVIGERHLLPLMVIFFLIMMPHVKTFFVKYYILLISVAGIAYFLFFDLFKTAAI